MTTSPARAHALRMAAQALAAPDATMANATGYELMLAKLHEDRRRLKQIESLARKIEVKRNLLPEYIPWVEGALQGNGAQDVVLMTVMVWRIDAGDWRGALQIAEYALRYQLLLPDQFGRNLPCLLAEEFADQALRGEPVPHEILIEADQLLIDHDMPDEVRAKLAKAIAYALLVEVPKSASELVPMLRATALEQLQRALKLHDKCGVKKDIDKLERELRNSAPTGATPPDGS
ncbi:terminase [Chitinimonas arctica]|uniref:Terminase n=1 Tax=Chitinimonas arctica TaxID=2594795 RepID=A0A516SLV9_9NEIS|nr:phage terminase small subunit [Chitinimonas arctica]QDQ27717.1 terminase [Chitinimonas arctica]QDQ29125.1 terminase [Chitinimonas arctica]